MTDPVAVAPGIELPRDELQFTAIRAQGAGGQNVNKVSSAVQLRFDVCRSRAFGDDDRRRILAHADRRISADGVIVIKAQRSRSQEQNRDDAIRRLVDLLGKALARQPVRRPTRPTKASKERRLADKSRRAGLKRSRTTLDD